MTDRVKNDDPLDDFDRREVTAQGTTNVVYTTGSGPAVLVLPEMPGITPDVARFARWTRAAGFTVWMPSLFGDDGAVPTMDLVMESMASLCVRREFEAFAANDPSPMTQWLRSLAQLAHEECGGPGVGVIGMCFTGNFALAMAIDDPVVAPVMSQPSLPLDDEAGTFVTDDDLDAIRRRLDRHDLTVRAYRFDGDTYCRAARFQSLEAALGDRFEPTVLPDEAAGDLGWIGVPHSVVTTSLVDADGELTAGVRDEILAFFANRLT